MLVKCPSATPATHSLVLGFPFETVGGASVGDAWGGAVFRFREGSLNGTPMAQLLQFLKGMTRIATLLSAVCFLSTALNASSTQASSQGQQQKPQSRHQKTHTNNLIGEWKGTAVVNLSRGSMNLFNRDSTIRIQRGKTNDDFVVNVKVELDRFKEDFVKNASKKPLVLRGKYPLKVSTSEVEAGTGNLVFNRGLLSEMVIEQSNGRAKLKWGLGAFPFIGQDIGKPWRGIDFRLIDIWNVSKAKP